MWPASHSIYLAKFVQNRAYSTLQEGRSMKLSQKLLRYQA
uniref:Uncharacterized protein n=1 Tax=Arundo donax TaxID=35708 RepID=A0A0A9CJA2_ARUDO